MGKIGRDNTVQDLVFVTTVKTVLQKGEGFMGECIAINDVTRIRYQPYLGKFHLLFLMTFCVVQPETFNNFRLVLCIVAMKSTSRELTLLSNTVYS